MPGLHRRLSRHALPDATTVRRLAVLRPDGMGDIVLTTGMLRELRRQLPSTRITFICQTMWAPWMRTCPWIDDVVEVEVTTSGNFREPKRLYEMLRFVRRTWPLDLEMLVHPGTLYEYVPSRALAWFSGAPARLCWEDPNAAVETGTGFFTRTLQFSNSLHETKKCFRLLEAIGLEDHGRKLDRWWTKEDGQRGDEIAYRARSGRRKLIALGLAASEPRKRWPRERYLEVIRDVSSQRDAAFLLLGGQDVTDTCRWLAERDPRVVSYAGDRLPLGTLWAAIASCDLYLGNDTGFMHMAAAARVPVVVVIGVPEGAPPGTRGDPSQTGPYDTISRVVRPPVGTPSDAEPDMAMVSPAAVTTAALELLT